MPGSLPTAYRACSATRAATACTGSTSKSACRTSITAKSSFIGSSRRSPDQAPPRRRGRMFQRTRPGPGALGRKGRSPAGRPYRSPLGLDNLGRAAEPVCLIRCSGGWMATILVAHGAWSAGWAWRKMRPLLRAAGHELLTPTYTGLGERGHLANPSIDLETHIRDVLGVLEFEDL